MKITEIFPQSLCLILLLPFYLLFYPFFHQIPSTYSNPFEFVTQNDRTMDQVTLRNNAAVATVPAAVGQHKHTVGQLGLGEVQARGLARQLGTRLRVVDRKRSVAL